MNLEGLMSWAEDEETPSSAQADQSYTQMETLKGLLLENPSGVCNTELLERYIPRGSALIWTLRHEQTVEWINRRLVVEVVLEKRCTRLNLEGSKQTRHAHMLDKHDRHDMARRTCLHDSMHHMPACMACMTRMHDMHDMHACLTCMHEIHA